MGADAGPSRRAPVAQDAKEAGGSGGSANDECGAAARDAAHAAGAEDAPLQPPLDAR